MKQKLKATKGITLIALVITIIIMLILVGVTVKMAINGGLFGTAKGATKDTEIQADRETLQAGMVPIWTAGGLNLDELRNNLPAGWNVEVNSEKTEATCTSPKGNVFTVYKEGNLAYQEGNGEGVVPPETPPGEITEGTIDKNNTDWALLSKIAVAISKNSSIPDITGQAEERVTTATAVVEGKSYTLNVGDVYQVNYEGETKPVRIIGFKHDELAYQEKTGAYAGCTYAGITFDFVDFMTGTTYYPMNTDNTNSGGWAATAMRKTLNGYSTTAESQNGTIGGLGLNLSNKNYIKQVKKTYGTQYNKETTSTSEDYLWLLSCAEIWSTGYKATGKGCSWSTEGSQYAWYKANEGGRAYNSNNSNFVKKGNSSASASWWSLRSPRDDYRTSFCRVAPGGYCDSDRSDVGYGVAPGFSI